MGWPSTPFPPHPQRSCCQTMLSLRVQESLTIFSSLILVLLCRSWRCPTQNLWDQLHETLPAASCWPGGDWWRLADYRWHGVIAHARQQSHWFAYWIWVVADEGGARYLYNIVVFTYIRLDPIGSLGNFGMTPIFDIDFQSVPLFQLAMGWMPEKKNRAGEKEESKYQTLWLSMGLSILGGQWKWWSLQIPWAYSSIFDWVGFWSQIRIWETWLQNNWLREASLALKKTWCFDET